MHPKDNVSCIIADIVVQAIGHEGIWITTFWSTSAICTIVANGLALTATIGSKQFKSSYNYLLMSLFISGFLSGSLVQILYAILASDSHFPNSCTWKRLALYFAAVSVVSSNFSIVGISWNLYFRTRKPRVYETFSNRQKWGIFIGIVWTLSFLAAITPVLFPEQTPLIPILVPLLFVSTVAYGKFMIKLRRSVRISPEYVSPHGLESSADYRRRCQRVVTIFLVSSLIIMLLPCLTVSLSHTNVKEYKAFRVLHRFTSTLPWIKHLTDPCVYLCCQKAGRTILTRRMRDVLDIARNRIIVRNRLIVRVLEQAADSRSTNEFQINNVDLI